MLQESKQFDAVANPEYVDMFLKDPFDLSITLPLSNFNLSEQQPENPFSSSSTAVAAATSSPTTSTNNNKKQQNNNQNKKQQQQSESFDNTRNNNDDDSDEEESSKNNNTNAVDKYDAMTHRDLQALCKKKGISTGGKKADMISRLRASS